MLGRDVVAAAGDAGHEVAALARADLDITDADAVRAAIQAARPDAVINCAAWTDVDGAEADEAGATAINGTAAGHVAAAAAETGAHLRPRVDRLRLRRRRGRAVSGGCRPLARAPPMGAPSSPASTPSTPPAAAAIVRSSWLFGPHGRNFVDTMRRLGAERERARGGRRPGGLPDLHGPPRAGAGRGRRAWAHRRAARGRPRPLLVVRPRQGDVRGGRHRLPRPASEHRRPSAARHHAPPSRRSPRPAATRPSCPHGARDCAPISPAWRSLHETAGLRRSRLHRLQLRPRAPRRARRRDHGARQAHLRRPAREPRRASTSA